MADENQRACFSSDDIIKKYFNMVYKLALLRTKQKSHADDVVQEVFLRYIQKAHTFKTEEHIKAWLIRVTINCSNSIFSTAWFRKTVPLSDEIPVDFSCEEHYDVYQAVLALPEKYRTVVHLFYYEELSTAQIAACLHEKESTVRSRLKRARDMLKIKLKGGYEYDI